MNFNAVKFAAIVAQAKAAAANSPRWTRAIERAAEALINGELIVTTLVDGAIVTSPRGAYHTNGRCDCAAAKNGMVCYHRAAARLVELYEAAILAPEPTAPKAETKTKPTTKAPKITRSVERDRFGVRHVVERCDGWMI
jgi:hypothetical protein